MLRQFASGQRSLSSIAKVAENLVPADIVAERAEGCYVWDTNGKRYLDFTSGIGVVSTGHCHPKVVKALQEQASQLIFAQQNILPATPSTIKLIDRLKRIVPSDLSRFFFCNSGSEAVDNALKIARSYTGRQNIIAFSGGYHGRTYGAMSLTTSKTVYRQSFGPLPSGVVVAPYPYCLHCKTRIASGGMGLGVAPTVPPVGIPYVERTCCGGPLEELRMLLKMQTHPKETAAIIIEPIMGEGGFLVPPPGFLSALRKICDEHGMLLIFDEVQAGMGRAGVWWSHQILGGDGGGDAVQPDIMIFAKGIASGFPFAGLATKSHLYDGMEPGMLGGTYGGSALGCAVASATIDAIEEDKMLENAQERGVQLMRGLVAMAESLPIAEVRGRGLMVAAEMSAPPGTASKVVKLAGERGLLLITAGSRETVRFLPPLVVTAEQAEEALCVFKESLAAAVAAAMGDSHDHVLDSTFATRYMTEPIPKLKMPEKGIPSNVVYQVIKDLRTLDARPNLNLASFVTTWMEPEARDLMMESLDVNFVDAEEYPSCQTIANRCVSMLACLFNSPSVDADGKGDAVGAPCVGSSEAIMLGGLAMKKRWVERRAAANLDTSKPNLVMGSETHVCWEKFCRYFDVEPRYILAEEGRYVATPELLAAQCDENTIGVCAVLGSTYTGEFEDVAGIDREIGKLNAAHDWNLVIHVDGASGAMVAPFAYPEVIFDFRLPNVASINISGHKYGLVYPGLGWVLWRDAAALPESIVFYCDYLGSLERSITLNFSRGASQIIGQYYQLLRLGKDGYAAIMNNLVNIAAKIRKSIEASDVFEVVSKEVGVPLVAFRLKPIVHSDGTTHKRLYDEFQVAERMRIPGWVLPAYAMPKGAEHIKLMRITIREDFSASMADQVIEELHNAVEWLENHFTMSRDDMTNLVGGMLGRKMSRLDTKIFSDISAVVHKPC